MMLLFSWIIIIKSAVFSSLKIVTLFTMTLGDPGLRRKLLEISDGKCATGPPFCVKIFHYCLWEFWCFCLWTLKCKTDWSVKETLACKGGCNTQTERIQYGSCKWSL